jgi:hypothetical protein
VIYAGRATSATDRVGAQAVARDAAGGVGGARTGEPRLLVDETFVIHQRRVRREDRVARVWPPLGLVQTILMPSRSKRPSRILRRVGRRRDSWSIAASGNGGGRICHRVPYHGQTGRRSPGGVPAKDD